jgi:hypothetical protein
LSARFECQFGFGFFGVSSERASEPNGSRAKMFLRVKKGGCYLRFRFRAHENKKKMARLTPYDVRSRRSLKELN